MAIVEWLVPVAGMMMTATIIGIVVWYKVKQAQYAQPQAEYRRLTEAALANQKAMAQEVQELTRSIQEIQRLLEKV